MVTYNDPTHSPVYNYLQVRAFNQPSTERLQMLQRQRAEGILYAKMEARASREAFLKLR